MVWKEMGKKKQNGKEETLSRDCSLTSVEKFKFSLLCAVASKRDLVSMKLLGLCYME